MPARRWTIAGGGAAVAVLVAAGTLTVRSVLSGDDEPTPPPATTPAGEAEAGAAPTTATSAAAAIPASIPAAAFLQAADAPGKARSAPERVDDQKLPQFCSASYDRPDRIGIRATQVLYIAGAGDPADATPRAAVYQDVIVFSADGATAFMTDLRAAVQGCATSTENGVISQNYDRGAVGAGDESVLIERTRPAFGDDGNPVGDGSLHHLFWAAVRVGDAVAFVANAGWESGSADRDDTVLLAQRAAVRLADWRR